VVNIVVVGSINMDLVVRASRIPTPGETVLGQDFSTYPGGKGANQAIAAVRQGARVKFIGRVGDDEFGRLLVDELEVNGVDVKHIYMDENAATGVALITLNDAGENAIVVASGANHRLSPDNIHAAETAFSGADVLLLQLETPLDTVTAGAEAARNHGVKVILNPAPATPLPGELLSRVDILIPNESETAQLTGLPVNNLSQVEKAGRTLVKRGISTVVVTLGERGAYQIEADKPARHISSYPVAVVDTTAAGDSFVGTFAVSLANGEPVDRAVERGCAAGALATTRLGAQQSIPTRSEIDNLLKEQRL